MLESKRALQLAAVVLALLVASVGPVGAEHVATVSEHSTHADFEDGTLNGAEIVGTDDARVVFGSFAEDFEDGDLSEYTINYPSRATVESNGFTGSNVLVLDTASSGDERTVYAELSAGAPEAGTTFAYDTSVETGAVGAVRFAFQDENNFYEVQFNQPAGEVRLRKTVGGTTTTLDNASGTLVGDHDVSVEWAADGAFTVDIQGANDTWQLTGSDTTFTSGALRWRAFSNSDITVAYDNLFVFTGDGEAGGSYVGAPHDAPGAIDGVSEFRIDGGSADVTWQGRTASGAWQNVTTATATGDETVTQSLSGGHDEWRIIVEWGGEGSVELLSEGVTAATAAPTVSNPRPSGARSSGTFTAEVDVGDEDFGRYDENLTATWSVNGEVQATTTITDEGTASAELSVSTGGDHTWSVDVTDRFGHTTSSGAVAIQTPSTLTVYNESDPEEVIDDASATITFYDDQGGVYERTTSDGVIDMAGLPADQTFEADVAAEGYRSRTVVIDSLSEQQRVYLLDENTTATTVEFHINDQTGEFGADSRLFVEKALNVSGNTSYQTIAGGQFDATEALSVTLEDDTRYRLRVESPQGQTRVLGSYLAAGSTAEELTIGEIAFDTGDADGGGVFAADLVTEQVDGQNVRGVRIAYHDPNMNTDSLSYEIVRDDGYVLQENTTLTGPYGEVIATVPLNANATEDAAYEIRWHADRDGADAGGTEIVGDVNQIANSINVDPTVLSLLGFLTIAATLGLFGVGYPQFAGIPTAAVATALVGLGFVEIPALYLAATWVVGGLFAVGGSR